MSENTAMKTAACAAHRACCGCEDDQVNGKIHGYCVVCGAVWPCDVAKAFIDCVVAEGPTPEWKEMYYAMKDQRDAAQSELATRAGKEQL